MNRAGKVDLHTHTKASDGKNTPSENVRLAREKGLSAIAITDHDTVMGVEEALEEGRKCGVEVLPGIEVSTLEKGQDIHVLGYFVDYENEAFNMELQKLRNTRNERNRMMVKRLQELGLDISIAEVEAKQTEEGGNVGRPHMAEVLMEKEVVTNLQEAFEKYLGKEGKAYVNPPRISPREGVRLIQRFGGIPVLAHPGLYDADELIDELIPHGLLGIEVYHPDHTEDEVRKYARIAAERKLIATGGSDYHGVRNGEVYHGDLGSQPVDMAVVEQLKTVQKTVHSPT